MFDVVVSMQSVFDWLTIGIFAFLVVIFLQRSAGERSADDKMWKYLPPALGCMIANYLGNKDMTVVGAALAVATMAYIWHFIYKGAPLPPR